MDIFDNILNVLFQQDGEIALPADYGSTTAVLNNKTVLCTSHQINDTG